MRLQLDRAASPIGRILLIHDSDGVLRGIDFEGHDDRAEQVIKRQYGEAERVEAPAPRATRDALEAYFAGEFDAIAALPFATAGTAFQRAAWAALRTIPPGVTRSYGEQAAAIGRPKAVRAVGLANGANPIAIATPCHRVIGANGSLTGFGGGLDRKRWLLMHEGAILA
jgi:methylated-DNA-[protein]-cysteine S-methyltransferase